MILLDEEELTDIKNPAGTPPHLFSVLSYNIHQCVGLDGRRDPARVAQIIKESGADVIGLQEVHSESGGLAESHQMDYLTEATGFQAVAGPTLVQENSRYGNVLLTSRKILSIHWLDLSFRSREPRGAIDADLDIQGEAVRVIVTHLGLHPRERRIQVKQLLTALAEERTRCVVLLSDINEWLPVYHPLRWLDARLGRTKPLRTFPSFFPLLALDRIWVSPQPALVSLSIYDTPLTRIASDHLPLKAVVRPSNASSMR
jgi:endonuclease/exonuclease/phosphatase family metal-dependent hydrolase